MTTTNKHVALRFGNGSKTHAGYQMTFDDGVTHVFTSCGSRKSGTAKRIMGDLDLKTFSLIPDRCDKCEDRVTAILKKVAA